MHNIWKLTNNIKQIDLEFVHLTKWTTLGKGISRTYSCPRDWRLSVSWGPIEGPRDTLWTPAQYGVQGDPQLRGSRGPNWGPPWQSLNTSTVRSSGDPRSGPHYAEKRKSLGQPLGIFAVLIYICIYILLFFIKVGHTIILIYHILLYININVCCRVSSELRIRCTALQRLFLLFLINGYYLLLLINNPDNGYFYYILLTVIIYYYYITVITYYYY